MSTPSTAAPIQRAPKAPKRRAKPIALRLTEPDRAKVAELAAQDGRSLASYCELAVLGQIRPAASRRGAARRAA